MGLKVGSGRPEKPKDIDIKEALRSVMNYYHENATKDNAVWFYVNYVQPIYNYFDIE